MDPAQLSLEFVRNREKTTEYIRQLKVAGQSNQTQLNYLKSLKRFLNYHITNTDLYASDPDLYQHAKMYLDFIKSKSKELNKGAGKEGVAKR